MQHRESAGFGGPAYGMWRVPPDAEGFYALLGLSTMKAPPNYVVQLPVFEGPLDLLLELIEHAELDITKVALAQVTDQYLAYMHQAAQHELEDLSSFLVIAARLLQIKSEALLPRPPEREPGDEDPGDALARQLVAYKKYKQIAIQLAEREAQGWRTYLRTAPVAVPDPKLDLQGVDLNDLRRVLQTLLAQIGRDETVESVVTGPVVRLRDRIQRIVAALRRASRTTFRHLLGDARSRLEIVVSFLAMLELIKQGQIQVSQDELFGDIEVERGPAWDEDQPVEFDLEFEE